MLASLIDGTAWTSTTLPRAGMLARPIEWEAADRCEGADVIHRDVVPSHDVRSLGDVSWGQSNWLKSAWAGLRRLSGLAVHRP